MAITQRIESLQKRHAQIELDISREESRPAQNAAILQSLKREKLMLKDEIARLIEAEEKAA